MGTFRFRCANESVSQEEGAVAGDQAEKWNCESCHSGGGDWRGKVQKEKSFGVALLESIVQRWLTLGELVGQRESWKPTLVSDSQAVLGTK